MSKRRRKHPIRRLIPIRPPVAAKSLVYPSMPASALDGWSSREIPASLRPLFVIILTHRQVVRGKEFHSPLVTCYEVVRALTLLGYSAEPLQVDVTLLDLHPSGKRIASVENHVVLNAVSFDRIVDPGLFLRRDVKRVVGPTALTTPVVFPKSPALNSPGNAIVRPPHAISYDFYSSMPITNLVEHVDAVLDAERNALLTACQALSIMLAMWHLDSDRITLNPLLQDYADQKLA